jgi:hypothetical protein
MKSKFITDLDVKLTDGDIIWKLDSSLQYYSEILEQVITVPVDFQTDFASVPRIPIIYGLWGDRAHREAVIHDYLYRINSNPVVSFSIANAVFFEAMKARGKPNGIAYPMFWGVCLGGGSSYHKKRVEDKL